MHKKFVGKWTKIKGGCQSGRKMVTHNSKSDLPIDSFKSLEWCIPCKKQKRICIAQLFSALVAGAINYFTYLRVTV